VVGAFLIELTHPEPISRLTRCIAEAAPGR